MCKESLETKRMKNEKKAESLEKAATFLEVRVRMCKAKKDKDIENIKID